MDINTGISQVLDATNKLTEEVSNKVKQINESVNDAKNDYEHFKSDLLKTRIVGGNLLQDPWLQNVSVETIDNKETIVAHSPPLFSKVNTSLEVVSAKTYGFSTRYGHAGVIKSESETPEKFTDNPWFASEETPLFAKDSQEKTIVPRGGFFAGDWSGLTKTGHIFRMHVKPVDLREEGNEITRLTNGAQIISSESNGIFAGLLMLRAWVYVKKGSLIFGNHAGYNGNESFQKKWEAVDFTQSKSEHPFKLVEVIFSPPMSANVVKQMNFASGDNESELEAYIASPQLFVLDHEDDKRKPMISNCFGGLNV
ncbi:MULTISPECIES: hypothetical protein [Pseudoalteromonas]|uniref:hypothetical protein n=1 Tax=Pseudoalteromonas TaxID=53246 RepID=UPI00057AD954|nr:MULTISPECIES: hypothetical protein [Pseudoalteromonas]ATG57932.1 hypothetical protein CPA52_06670 [Pseudoalteromonas marina]